jgi:hypothetical protein
LLGAFNAPAAVSIDGSTGVIDLSLSTPGGPFTITYTIPGPCAGIPSFDVAINALDDPAFSHSAAAYCQGDPVQSSTITGLGGGSFSFVLTSGAGQTLDISTGTGIITQGTSGTGVYDVIYLTSGPCPQSSTVSVEIIVNDDPAFSYASSTYCQSGVDPTPTITGLAGGAFTFTVVSGGPTFNINGGTGEITLGTSDLGTFDVTYTTTGPCLQSLTVQTTITDAPAASFTYPNNPYCQGDVGNAFPAFGVASSAGVFAFVVVSCGPNLVFASVNTGEVDLTASDPGVYDVTNFIAASGGCAADSSTSQITITAQDDPSFRYNPNYCLSDPNPIAMITGVGGGVFNESTAVLIWVSTSTGEVDLASTPAGTYVINALQTARAQIVQRLPSPSIPMMIQRSPILAISFV